jgi:hypothetical protein
MVLRLMESRLHFQWRFFCFRLCRVPGRRAAQPFFSAETVVRFIPIDQFASRRYFYLVGQGLQSVMLEAARTRPPAPQRGCECGGAHGSGGQCARCRSRRPAAGDAPASPGSPLESSVRARAERSFGQDFSQVRVHSDAAAARSAEAFGASAYTVGSHIVFGADRYSPREDRSQRLVWHELAHVLQQQGIRGDPRMPQPSQAAAGHTLASGAEAEHEAADLAGKVAAGEPARVRHHRPRSVARQALDDEDRIRQSLGFAPQQPASSGIYWLGQRPSGLHADPATPVHWLGTAPSASLAAAVSQDVHQPRAQGQGGPAPAAPAQARTQARARPPATAGAQAGQLVPRPPGLPLDQSFMLVPAQGVSSDLAARIPEGQIVELPRPGAAGVLHRAAPYTQPLMVGGGLGGLAGLNQSLRQTGFAAAGPDAIGIIAVPRMQLNPFKPNFNMLDPAAPLDTLGHSAYYVRQGGRITVVRGYDPDMFEAALHYGALERGVPVTGQIKAGGYLLESTASRTLEWPVSAEVAARAAEGAPPTTGLGTPFPNAASVGEPPLYTTLPADAPMQCTNCGLWATGKVEGQLGGPVGRAGQAPITDIGPEGVVPRTASQGRIYRMIGDAEAAAKAGEPSPIAGMPGATGEAVAGSMSTGLKVIKYGGRVFIVVGLVVSAAEIYNATEEERPRVITTEAAGWAGGFAGGFGAGALAGLACGPGAPVCSVLFGLGGGVLGALGARALAGEIYDELHPKGQPVTDPLERRRLAQLANRPPVCPQCHGLMHPAGAPPPGGPQERRIGDVLSPALARPGTPSAQDMETLRAWVDAQRSRQGE